MLSEDVKRKDIVLNDVVLILVLMEYALWARNFEWHRSGVTVLILVLMEYALWVGQEEEWEGRRRVLILVLMEYALWVQNRKSKEEWWQRS